MQDYCRHGWSRSIQWILNMYMAISNAGDFKKKCIKRKKKTPANRAIKQQPMTHFNEAYEVLNTKHDILPDSDITNSAKIQSDIQAMQDTMTTIQDKLEKTRVDNTALHALLQNAITQKQHSNDDTTVISSMLAMTVLNGNIEKLNQSRIRSITNTIFINLKQHTNTNTNFFYPENGTSKPREGVMASS